MAAPAPPRRNPANPAASAPDPDSQQPPAPRRQSGATRTVAIPTLLGALAVLTGATAITPLVAGLTYLTPLVEVVAIIWLVGIGARLLLAPAWAVELAQLAAAVMTITSLHLTSGIAGIIPGPAAFAEGSALVGAAWQQIMTTVPPVPPTAEISFFITLAIGGLALVVDLLIAGSRTPALTALPLLALYSIPASIAADLLPWYAFVLPTVCYAALLATSGPHDGRVSPRTAVRLGLTTAVIATIAIGGSVLVTAASTGIGTEGRIPHTGAVASQIGLSTWARLRGELTDSNSVDVLRVAGLTRPEYLRTVALEKWTPDTGFGIGPVVANADDIDGALPANGAVPVATEIATITPQHFRDKYLPLYLAATAVDGIEPGWNYDAALRSVFRSTPATPDPYTITVDATTASAAQLRGEPIATDAALTEAGSLPAEVTRLARSITANATTPFDQVDAILHYFTDPKNGFSYSLKTPLGNSGSALVDFLTTKQGYCEQYAAAMTIMVRALGIPARVGIGFTQGERLADGSYQVRSTNAHAWVEVPFADSGWVIFDPTPAVDGQGGLQGFTPGPVGTDASTTGTGALASSAAPTAPTTTPSLKGANPTRGQTIPDADAAQSPAGGSQGADLATVLRWALLGLAAAAVVLLLVLAPALVRRLRRRRRYARAASGSVGAASAAWREVTDTMLDHGLELHSEDSARVTANKLAQAARLSTRERGALRLIITTAEQEWYAETQQAAPDLRAGIDAVVGGLRRTEPTRLRHRWWPPSLRLGRATLNQPPKSGY